MPLTHGLLLAQAARLHERIMRRREGDGMQWFSSILTEFFDPALDAKLSFSIKELPQRQYDMNSILFARFFLSMFGDGVKLIQFHIDAFRETSSTQVHVLDCSAINMILTFADLSKVISHGQLRIGFNNQLKITHWHFNVQRTIDLLPKNLVQTWINQAMANNIPIRLPRTVEYGLPAGALRCLDFAQTFALLKEVMIDADVMRCSPVDALAGFNRKHMAERTEAPMQPVPVQTRRPTTQAPPLAEVTPGKRENPTQTTGKPKRQKANEGYKGGSPATTPSALVLDTYTPIAPGGTEEITSLFT